MDARRLFRRLAELAEESSGTLSAVDPRRRGSRMRADYVKRTIAALMVEMRLNPYAVMLGVPGDGFVRECCEEALGRMRFLSDNMADPWADLNLFSAHGVDPLRVYTRAHPETGFRLPDEEEMDDWVCGRG
jgi:hypothetical protein